MKLNTNVDLLKAVRGFYESHVTALHGVIEKMPESLRAELKQLHDGMNEQLKKLPPLEQVPAALDANWAFQTFGEAIERVMAYGDRLAEQMKGLAEKYAGTATSLNSLEAEVKAGEKYLTAARAKEMCDLARSQGRDEMLPELMATRKGALELAGLPVPGDEVLKLATAEYDGRLKQAKANIATLAEKGLKVGGRGEALVQQLAWLAATEFAGQMTVFEDVLGAPKGKAADPLLGAPGGEAKKAATNNGRTTISLV